MRLKTWAALAAALTLPFLHGCGNDDANQYAKFVRMTDEVAETDEDERYVNPSLP